MKGAWLPPKFTLTYKFVVKSFWGITFCKSHLDIKKCDDVIINY